MTEERIDDGCDQRRDQQVADEAHGLGDRSRRDRDRGGDEAQLEQKEDRVVGAVATPEGEPVAADPAELAGTEHQPVSEQEEDRRGDQEIGEVLGSDVDRVLRPQQAALECGEPGLHREHERRRDEQPQNVDCFWFGHQAARPEALMGATDPCQLEGPADIATRYQAARARR